MSPFKILLVFLLTSGLIACSPVQTTASNQYKLESFSDKKLSSKLSHRSILITPPEAVAGYQTEQMIYTDKPYELSAFVNSAWVGPPADMLFPLLLQSIQRSGYFYATASSVNANVTDYRLDTQLLELKQYFLTKPSEIRFSCKIILTHVSDNRIVASRIISLRIPCDNNTPYAGVIAANKAAASFTAKVADFLVHHVSHDQLA